jgi:hypothetical protein
MVKKYLVMKKGSKSYLRGLYSWPAQLGTDYIYIDLQKIIREIVHSSYDLYIMPRIPPHEITPSKPIFPEHQTGSGGAGLGCGLGHVWGAIRNAMLLSNPLKVGPCYSPCTQAYSWPLHKQYALALIVLIF